MRAVVAAGLCMLLAPAAGAQLDSTRSLERVVISAERTLTALSSSSSAVTLISAQELARLPHATAADILRLVPGFSLVDFDGVGRDPQLMVRGFYGGGEAEYVVVLVDGKAVGGAHNGVIPWDMLPPIESIESVEVVRGSASALYGDAAVGAVINILTRRVARRVDSWQVQGGTLGAVHGSGTIGWPGLLVTGSLGHDGGYRDHAERRAGTLSLRAARDGSSGRSALSVSAYGRDSDEPGPLLEDLARQDRRASDALFRFDRTRDLGVRAGIDRQSIYTGSVLTLSGTADYRDLDATRTIALAPGFGDTKERDLSHRRFGGTAQLDVGLSPLPGFSRLTMGLELGHAALDSRYYEVVTGDRDAYLASDGARGALDGFGGTTRSSAALFTHYAFETSPAVRFSLGLRGDWLRDRFDPQSVSGLAPSTTTHAALSPKAGVNIRYLGDGNAEASGHFYLTAGTSFKSPTLDQLFDQRSIPLPFPPFRATTSNDALTPQRGRSVEAGVYHSVLAGGTIVAGTLSAYQTDMRDELDFDVSSLRYVNVGRSRHRGLEAGVTVSMRSTAPAFVNYALQSVTARQGEFAGNALKAIPRHTIHAGFPVGVGSAYDPRLLIIHTGSAFLDDANTRRLPAYTRVDLQSTVPVGRARLMIEIRNVFNAQYSTTGYLDPSGSGQAYLYPASGRIVQAGIRSGW